MAFLMVFYWTETNVSTKYFIHLCKISHMKFPRFWHRLPRGYFTLEINNIINSFDDTFLCNFLFICAQTYHVDHLG